MLSATDPVSRQCQSQSIMHLIVGFGVGGIAIIAGLVFTSIASGVELSTLARPRTPSPSEALAWEHQRRAWSSEKPSVQQMLVAEPPPLPPVPSALTAAEMEGQVQPTNPRQGRLVLWVAFACALSLALGVAAFALGQRHGRSAKVGTSSSRPRSVPSSSESPTLMATPDPDSELSSTRPTGTPPGYGPVKIGMGLAQLRATGTVTSWVGINQGDDCVVLPLRFVGAHVWYQGSTDRVVGIEFGGAMETSAGIHVGSSQSDLLVAYPEIGTANASIGEFREMIRDDTQYRFAVQQGQVDQITLYENDQQCAE
jgi:hypothetical protein